MSELTSLECNVLTGEKNFLPHIWSYGVTGNTAPGTGQRRGSALYQADHNSLQTQETAPLRPASPAGFQDIGQ